MNNQYIAENIAKNTIIPSILAIKLGKRKKYLHKSIDEVWQSILLVVIQEGIVVHSSYEKKLLLIASSPPIAVHINSSHGGVDVYINSLDFMDDMIKIYLKENRDVFISNVFEKTSLQLYSTTRWPWLITKD